MLKKIYYTFLPIAVLIFFIIRFVIPQLSKDSRCITHNEFLRINLNGVVLKKYIDSSEHSFPIIEIKNFNSSSIEKLNLNLDTSGIYNKINIQDTLNKEVGKDEIFLVKNKEKALLSKVDFGCSKH
ncbi:MAG: hypothetical protein JWO92_1246 [Chitinophagaceae bacterium]|nr:hypothetical protein [Chitinophagaceae bacterium]